MERSENLPRRDSRETIATCQKILRFTTGVILTAFVLIIALTTISTGPFMQVAGKALYYVIVLDAVVSLGTWYYRTRLEKRLRDAAA